MGLLQDCKEYFAKDDLYEILQLSRNASQAQIKKAYKQMSLLVHPDRVDPLDVKEATRKFQVLSKIHFILSDDERRAVYDDSGEIVGDDDNIEQERDWKDYWRLLFPKLTLNDIDNFEKDYIGSEQEREDLKNCYVKYEGDMNKMYQCIMFYNFLEEDRYYSILNDMIEKEEIPDFPAFKNKNASKRRNSHKKSKKEAAEAKELLKELNADRVSESCESAITKRAHDRKSDFDSLISSLEQKYAKKAKVKKSK